MAYGDSGVREALRRTFDVAVPLEHAWDFLANVERWPSWAPHIDSVTVRPVGTLGPSSAGTIRLRGGLRTTFHMAVWEPHRRWVWVGRAGGLTVHYDHQFEPGADGTTTMVWIVGLSGLGSRFARRLFASRYGRNVDAAIPRLQAALRGDRDVAAS